MAEKVSAQSTRPDGQADRVRVSGPLCEGVSAIGHLSYVVLGSTPRSSLGGFESHGSRHAIDFAGAKCQQQVTALKVSAANQIDDA